MVAKARVVWSPLPHSTSVVKSLARSISSSSFDMIPSTAELIEFQNKTRLVLCDMCRAATRMRVQRHSDRGLLESTPSDLICLKARSRAACANYITLGAPSPDFQAPFRTSPSPPLFIPRSVIDFQSFVPAVRYSFASFLLTASL